LTAWLRVPIDWVSSTTVAQFPNETHSDIRRVFTPLQEPNCKRIFCGYCGTHLSYWTEQPAAEADYLSVTLGSLLSEDIHALQELDLLPEDATPEELGATTDPRSGALGSSEVTSTTSNESAVQRSSRSGRLGDLDWFEEMINGSQLGRTQKTRRGMGVSADGTTQVSWEVSEYFEGDNGSTASHNSGSKRKAEEIGEDDIAMKQ
jgi:hypothetical protein